MSDLESWILHGEEMRRPLIFHPELKKSSKLIIVGGGLSGLCCAYRVAKKRPDLEIIIHEKTKNVGGVISTWRSDGWVCDLAVNAARPHPAFWRLVDDLDLQSVFKTSNPVAKSRWILIDGKRHRLSWRTLFKLGPIRLYNSIKKSRTGGLAVSELIPNKQVADAMCLGIVNDTSENVDADFLFPSMTRFGSNPPLKRSKLKKLIHGTYPIFTPKRGTISSIENGMQTLVDKLDSDISTLPNVSIVQGEATSPEMVAKLYDVPQSSVIWAAPSSIISEQYTSLSIFAIGFKNEQVDDVELGYGTLIPNPEMPISGILHESDVHDSSRAPSGHRLFRLMVPHWRWDGENESVRRCAESLLSSNPVLFEKIGERKIPRYLPGHLQKMTQLNPECTYVGWCYSGVSVTHVVDQAERISELF